MLRKQTLGKSYERVRGSLSKTEGSIWPRSLDLEQPKPLRKYCETDELARHQKLQLVAHYRKYRAGAALSVVKSKIARYVFFDGKHS